MKILSTKNYRLFHRSDENRPLQLGKHKKLFQSMQLYGFLRCFPIVVFRAPDGNLVIKDGQHRAELAEKLGLTIYYVEEETDFDVAVINCTSRTWSLRDYAQKFANNGVVAYREGLDFADGHRLPIGMAFALLAGTTTFHNCQDAFVGGSFEVKDREWATAVAALYTPLVMLAPAMKGQRFIEACMAVCRVKEFEQRRMLENAKRRREELIGYSTRDAYLSMMEEVYNYGRVKLFGLKSAAIMAMRERNVAKAKKGKVQPESELAEAIS